MIKSCRNLPRFDYLGAYAHIIKTLKVSADDTGQQAALADLCSSIVKCHGLSFEKEEAASWKSIAFQTLDLFRPNLLTQLEEESEADQSFHANEGPIFSTEHGWEADVFLSRRPQYLNSVLKVYRYHNLGTNPRYPGFGWIANPNESQLKLSSANRISLLPHEPFVPAKLLNQLESRFALCEDLSFFAKILNRWQTDEAFILEQERVIPVRTFTLGEIFQAASQFLSVNQGVFFHSPVVETAVISCSGKYFLLQDFINNLAYPITSNGQPDRSRPVIFDGNLMPLTNIYLKNYPALADAVNLIQRTYPTSAKDSLNTEASPTEWQEIEATMAYPPPFSERFAPKWLASVN